MFINEIYKRLGMTDEYFKELFLSHETISFKYYIVFVKLIERLEELEKKMDKYMVTYVNDGK